MFHPIIDYIAVKISYSCMPNMASHISSHNKNIIQEFKKSQYPNPKHDWRAAEDYPLNGNCKQLAVVYQGDVTPEGPFKEKLSDHCTSFKYEQYKNKSKLPSFIWETKNKGLNFEIKWSVVRRSTTYKAESKKCNLCLWENFHIMTGDKDTLLTERYELITKCKHIDKYLLKSYKSRRGRRRKGRVRGR